MPGSATPVAGSSHLDTRLAERGIEAAEGLAEALAVIGDRWSLAAYDLTGGAFWDKSLDVVERREHQFLELM